MRKHQGGTVRQVGGRPATGSRGGAGLGNRGRSLLYLLLLPSITFAGPQTPTLFYPARYYPDSPDPSGASPVSMMPGETSSPLVLTPESAGGALSVRVLEEDGTPVAGILVEAALGRFRAVAVTGVDGRATVSGIPAGRATLRTRPDDLRSETGAFAVRYLPGVTDPALAERFTISDRNTTEAGDLRVPRAGRIKVTVLRPNQQAWFDTPVVLRSTDGTIRYEHRTDAEGRATFGGLDPGLYRLWVDARGTDAVTECSDGTRDTLAAMPIDLPSRSLVSGIVLQTDRGGEVRGAIRDLRSNVGLRGVEVRLLPQSSPGTTFRFFTDALGFYFAYGLPSGAYKVYVPAIRRWYPSSQTEGGARLIAVAEGESMDSIDIRGELDPPCRIAPESAGVIEGGVQADFSRMTSAQVVAWTGTDTFRVTVTHSSIYWIACLPAGKYFVAFVPDGVYRTQYHPLTNDPASAQMVTVTQGDTTRRVSFSPERGIVLEGSVISKQDGIGIAEMPVFAMNLSLGMTVPVRTDVDGFFRVDRLPDRTGVPAGEWFVSTDSLAVSGIAITPALAVGLEGEWMQDGVRLTFLLPDGLSVRAWSMEKSHGGGEVIVIADAVSHPDGVAARACIDPAGCGACRYRLTVTIDRYGEAVDLRSDWIEIGPRGGDLRSVAPHPWNGRGWLRLPHPAVSQESVDLFGPDGAHLMVLPISGDGVSFEGGRIPPSGIYFLRWRGENGRDHTARLVLKR